MGFTDQSIAKHFKVSVTGETVFVFGVWPWPTSQRGRVIASEDDIEKIKSRLRAYYKAVFFLALPVGTAILGSFLRLGFTLPGSELLQSTLAVIVTTFVGGTLAASVFRRCVLDPIIRKYPLAHPKMEYIEVQQDTAEATGWRRFGRFGRGGLIPLLMLGGGVVLLRSGETIVGVCALVAGGIGVVRLVRDRAKAREQRERDRWMVR